MRYNDLGINFKYLLINEKDESTPKSRTGNLVDNISVS